MLLRKDGKSLPRANKRGDGKEWRIPHPEHSERPNPGIPNAVAIGDLPCRSLPIRSSSVRLVPDSNPGRFLT
jgi:hypothetical protein